MTSERDEMLLIFVGLALLAVASGAALFPRRWLRLGRAVAGLSGRVVGRSLRRQARPATTSY